MPNVGQAWKKTSNEDVHRMDKSYANPKSSLPHSGRSPIIGLRAQFLYTNALKRTIRLKKDQGLVFKRFAIQVTFVVTLRRDGPIFRVFSREGIVTRINDS